MKFSVCRCKLNTITIEKSPVNNEFKKNQKNPTKQTHSLCFYTLLFYTTFAQHHFKTLENCVLGELRKQMSVYSCKSPIENFRWGRGGG